MAAIEEICLCEWVSGEDNHGPCKTSFNWRQTVYCYCEISGTSQGGVVKWSWKKNGVEKYSYTWTIPEDWNYVWAYNYWIPSESGQWKVDIYYNNNRIGSSLDFTVAEPPPVVDVVSINADPRQIPLNSTSQLTMTLELTSGPDSLPVIATWVLQKDSESYTIWETSEFTLYKNTPYTLNKSWLCEGVPTGTYKVNVWVSKSDWTEIYGTRSFEGYIQIIEEVPPIECTYDQYGHTIDKECPGCTLNAGWNYIKYTGETMSCEDATAAIENYLSIIYYYDGTNWYSYIPGTPSDLTTLVNNNCYAINVTSSVQWPLFPIMATATIRNTGNASHTFYVGCSTSRSISGSGCGLYNGIIEDLPLESLILSPEESGSVSWTFDAGGYPSGTNHVIVKVWKDAGPANCLDGDYASFTV